MLNGRFRLCRDDRPALRPPSFLCRPAALRRWLRLPLRVLAARRRVRRPARPLRCRNPLPRLRAQHSSLHHGRHHVRHRLTRRALWPARSTLRALLYPRQQLPHLLQSRDLRIQLTNNLNCVHGVLFQNCSCSSQPAELDPSSSPEPQCADPGRSRSAAGWASIPGTAGPEPLELYNLRAATHFTQALSCAGVTIPTTPYRIRLDKARERHREPSTAGPKHRGGKLGRIRSAPHPRFIGETPLPSQGIPLIPTIPDKIEPGDARSTPERSQ